MILLQSQSGAVKIEGKDGVGGGVVLDDLPRDEGLDRALEVAAERTRTVDGVIARADDMRFGAVGDFEFEVLFVEALP